MTDVAVPQRPTGKIVGRQPAVVHIVPSRPNPWYGIILMGQVFTRQQLARLEASKIDPATVERMTVYRNATDAEMWWPPAGLPPVYAFECPVLTRRLDGRIRVIAPNGDGKLVFPDGWTTAPKKRRGRAGQ